MWTNEYIEVIPEQQITGRSPEIVSRIRIGMPEMVIIANLNRTVQGVIRWYTDVILWVLMATVLLYINV